MNLDDDIIKLNCISNYEWPNELAHCKLNLDNLQNVVDLKNLYILLNSFSKQEDIFITFLSKEYLEIGKLWIYYIKKTNSQFIIFATDNETIDYLNVLNLPFCKAIVHVPNNVNSDYKSKTGFSIKGLSITALKYPLVKLILSLNYNVFLTDIDALILKKPGHEWFSNVDIAFQRVRYFPDPIAQAWGFTACSGFVWFQSNKNTISIVDNSITYQQNVYSDQIALNLALWDSKINWHHKMHSLGSYNSEFDAHQEFLKYCDQSIEGTSQSNSLNIRSLPPTEFYRNEITGLNISNVTVFHPNSPKTQSGKIDVFKKYNIF